MNRHPITARHYALLHGHGPILPRAWVEGHQDIKEAPPLNIIPSMALQNQRLLSSHNHTPFGILLGLAAALEGAIKHPTFQPKARNSEYNH